MSLTRELLLAHSVEHVELSRECGVGLVPAGSELGLHNYLPIGDHHTYPPEEGLEVLRKLLSAGIARVHSNKDPNCILEGAYLTVGEGKVLLALTEAVEYGVQLLGDDTKNREGDSVELIETTPRSSS